MLCPIPLLAMFSRSPSPQFCAIFSDATHFPPLPPPPPGPPFVEQTHTPVPGRDTQRAAASASQFEDDTAAARNSWTDMLSPERGTERDEG